MSWVVYVLLSALFIAVASIFNKKALFHEHALEFTASRGVFFIFFALFLIPFVDFNISWKIYLLIYFIATLVSIGSVYVNKSLRHGELSVISPLSNLSPFFLLIIAYFALGEVPTSKQYFGIFLLIFGTYWLEVGVTNKGFLEPIKIFAKSKIIHYLMISMIIFSVTATFDKFVITNYTTPLTYLFLLMIFKSINHIALESYRFGWREIKKNIKKDFKLLFGGAFSLFIADIFYFSAVSFQNAPISVIIPLKRTSTLFTTIFGGKLFHEKNLLVKVLSCIIMVWGAVFTLL